MEQSIDGEDKRFQSGDEGWNGDGAAELLDLDQDAIVPQFLNRCKDANANEAEQSTSQGI